MVGISGEFPEKITGKFAKETFEGFFLEISERISSRNSGGFSWGIPDRIIGCIPGFISGRNSKAIPCVISAENSGEILEEIS